MRAAAAAAMLQFLLDYPLGSGRLRGHVQFLLSNAVYEHESGRLQALELLQQASPGGGGGGARGAALRRAGSGRGRRRVCGAVMASAPAGPSWPANILPVPSTRTCLVPSN